MRSISALAAALLTASTLVAAQPLRLGKRVNLGNCNPAVAFAEGVDGQEGTFQPEDQESFPLELSSDINTVTGFICSQLASKCQPDQNAVVACARGQQAATLQNGQAAADAFNNALGVQANAKADDGQEAVQQEDEQAAEGSDAGVEGEEVVEEAAQVQDAAAGVNDTAPAATGTAPVATGTGAPASVNVTVAAAASTGTAIPGQVESVVENAGVDMSRLEEMLRQRFPQGLPEDADAVVEEAVHRVVKQAIRIINSTVSINGTGIASAVHGTSVVVDASVPPNSTSGAAATGTAVPNMSYDAEAANAVTDALGSDEGEAAGEGEEAVEGLPSVEELASSEGGAVQEVPSVEQAVKEAAEEVPSVEELASSEGNAVQEVPSIEQAVKEAAKEVPSVEELASSEGGTVQEVPSIEQAVKEAAEKVPSVEELASSEGGAVQEVASSVENAQQMNDTMLQSTREGSAIVPQQA